MLRINTPTYLWLYCRVHVNELLISHRACFALDYSYVYACIHVHHAKTPSDYIQTIHFFPFFLLFSGASCHRAVILGILAWLKFPYPDLSLTFCTLLLWADLTCPQSHRLSQSIFCCCCCRLILHHSTVRPIMVIRRPSFCSWREAPILKQRTR
jgi:hypothetical protein